MNWMNLVSGLQAVRWSLCAALALAAGVLWFRVEVPEEWRWVVAAVALLAGFMLLFQVGEQAWRVCARHVEEKRRANSVQQPFGKLSKAQKGLLVTEYAAKRREMWIPEGDATERWIQELVEWNYLKWIGRNRLDQGYRVTLCSWREVEKHMVERKRP